MEVDQILKQMEHLSVENLYVGRIRLEKLSIVMDAERSNRQKLFYY